jgi:hypothetical protein
MNKKIRKQKNKRQDFWSDHIRSWKFSGLSQSEYCRKNNLDINLFSKWKRRFLNAGFVEVKAKISKIPKIPNTYPVIEVEVNGIYRLKIKPDFDVETTKKILSILGGLQ